MHRVVGAPRVIRLFGELFGGAYLLPDVAALPHATLSKLPCADTDAPLGFPPIADNIAEGLVLKPDARLPVEKRFVLKKKIAEFDDARLDEGLPF